MQALQLQGLPDEEDAELGGVGGSPPPLLGLRHRPRLLHQHKQPLQQKAKTGGDYSTDLQELLSRS